MESQGCNHIIAIKPDPNRSHKVMSGLNTGRKMEHDLSGRSTPSHCILQILSSTNSCRRHCAPKGCMPRFRPHRIHPEFFSGTNCMAYIVSVLGNESVTQSHLHTADHKQRAATEGPTTPCKAVLIINLVHGLTKVFCSQVQAVRLRLVLLATSATIAVFIYKPSLLE